MLGNGRECTGGNPLTEEVQLKTIRCKCGGGDSISIKFLELMSMVVTAYLMVAMRGGRPDRERVTMLMRGDDSSAVQWTINCIGGRKEEVRAGALMRILGALETQGELWFTCEGVDKQTRGGGN